MMGWPLGQPIFQSKEKYGDTEGEDNTRPVLGRYE